MAYIKAGTGVHIDYDFTRLMVDTPFTIDVDATKRARAGEVIGTIAADMSSRLGFMRRATVRVRTERRFIVESET